MSGGRVSSNVGANTSTNDASKPSKVEEAIDAAAARKAIGDLLSKDRDLCPHFIRIAFYDAISYNPSAKVDGPDGSIRLWEGLNSDQQMKTAISKLDDIKARYPISYADLYQLAGIEAVNTVGGPPTIEFQQGRKDSIHVTKLPTIEQDPSSASLRATFYHIGFTDKEIVALSCAFYYWTNYPQPNFNAFSTSYFEKLLEVSKTETSNTSTTETSNTSTTAIKSYWKCLVTDASFLKLVVLFAKDADLFTKEYASAHKKLSELGFKYFPDPILTEAESKNMKHGIAFAMAMTILVGFVAFFYEVMKT